MRGVEARLLPHRNFRYHLLPAEPIYRRQWWKNVRWPFVGGQPAARAERAVRRGASGRGARHRRLRLGARWCGGPARLGIPTAIQEQNAYPGLVEPAGWPGGCGRSTSACPRRRRTSTRARTARCSTPATRSRRPTPGAGRARAAALRARAGPPHRCSITGGSQGALAINQAVADWIGGGGAARRGDPLGHRLAAPTSSSSTSIEPPDVQVIAFLDPMADGYAVADLVVSRAGMMTIAELCAWGLPEHPDSAADGGGRPPDRQRARAWRWRARRALLLQSGAHRRAPGRGDRAPVRVPGRRGAKWPSRPGSGAGPTPRRDIVRTSWTPLPGSVQFPNCSRRHNCLKFSQLRWTFSHPTTRVRCTSWASAAPG